MHIHPRHTYEPSKYFQKLGSVLYLFHIKVAHLKIQDEHCSIIALAYTMTKLSSHHRLTTGAGLAVSKSLLSLRLKGINHEELLPNTAILSPAYKIQLNVQNEINQAAPDTHSA